MLGKVPAGKTLREILCFGIVGVAATAVHYLVAVTAVEAAGLGVYAANFIGYLFAVGVSFLGHGRLTFRRDLNAAIFGRFALVSVTTFLLSEVLLAGLEEHLRMPHRLALAWVVLFVPALSFVLNKFWVYRHP